MTAGNVNVDIGPIVSSAHLASGESPALSEFEFGLILASHAFHRWMARAMAAAGIADLSAIDVLVLHTINHRDKAKRLADICLVLNVEDTHVVAYAIKKLERQKLVRSKRVGKEKFVEIAARGREACLAYRAIREQLLVRTVKATGHYEATGPGEATLSNVAALLRTLSGHYDQAARSAASL